MFWTCIRIASVRRFEYTSTTYDFMENYRNFSLFIILIPTPDFPYFYYMLGGNLGSLLYGDVSVMNAFSFQFLWFPSQLLMKEYDFLRCLPRPGACIIDKDKVPHIQNGLIWGKDSIYDVIEFYYQKLGNLKCVKRNFQENYFKRCFNTLYESLETNLEIDKQNFGQDANLLIMLYHVKSR